MPHVGVWPPIVWRHPFADLGQEQFEGGYRVITCQSPPQAVLYNVRPVRFGVDISKP